MNARLTPGRFSFPGTAPKMAGGDPEVLKAMTADFAAKLDRLTVEQATGAA